MMQHQLFSISLRMRFFNRIFLCPQQKICAERQKKSDGNFGNIKSFHSFAPD